MSKFQVNIDAMRKHFVDKDANRNEILKKNIYLKQEELEEFLNHLATLKTDKKINKTKLDNILKNFQNDTITTNQKCGIKKIKSIMDNLDTLYEIENVPDKTMNPRVPVPKNIPVTKNVSITKNNMGTNMFNLVEINKENNDEDLSEDLSEDLIEDLIEDLSDDNKNLTKNKELTLVKQQPLKNINWEITDDILEKHNKIELNLDSTIDKYNKYKIEHPMEYVTFLNSKNTFRIRCKTLKIDTCNQKSSDACEYMKNQISENLDPENKKKLIPSCSDRNHENGTNSKNGERGEKGKKGEIFPIKKSFQYANLFFVTYWFNEQPYFDIEHIISILDVGENQQNAIHREHKDEIILHMWHKNEFGGYILRKLISEITMYKIILKSRSDLANTLRNDIGNIMVQLRKLGALEITNEGINLTKIPKKKSKKNIEITDDEYIMDASKNYFMPYTWNTVGVHGILTHYASLCSQKLIVYHLHRHFMYAILLFLQRAISGGLVVIKFGYGEFFYNRMETLRTEYKCSIHIIGAKLIEGKSDEEKFHTEMRTRFPNLIFETEINGNDKRELYKFNPILMEIFDEYKDYTGSKAHKFPAEIKDKNLTEIANLESDLINTINHFGLGPKDLTCHNTTNTNTNNDEIIKIQQERIIEQSNIIKSLFAIVTSNQDATSAREQATLVKKQTTLVKKQTALSKEKQKDIAIIYLFSKSIKEKIKQHRFFASFLSLLHTNNKTKIT